MLHLVAGNLLRAPMRCLLAVTSFASAFGLFVLLVGIAEAHSVGIQGEPYLRIATMRRYNTGFLPPDAVAKLRDVPGIESLTPIYNLPVYYQHPSEAFIAVAVSPPDYLAMFDLALSDATRRCFLGTRAGAIASAEFASRFAWDDGDRVPLISSHDLTRLGDKNWPFEFCGTFVPPREVAFEFLANFDFVDEYHIAPVRKYRQFIARVTDPAAIGEISAAIDALFPNERHATESVPLDQYQRRQMRLLGDDFAATAIFTLGAVFFALMVSTVCSTSQSVRTRTAEFAILRTVGFQASATLALVALETGALALAGATLGMGTVVGFEEQIAAMLRDTVGRYDISTLATIGGVGLALLLASVAAVAATLPLVRRPIATLLRAPT